MPKMTLTRRQILAALGLGAGFLPFLSSRSGRADSPSLLPPNVIFLAWPNGFRDFWPAGGETSFTIVPDDDSVAISPLAPWKDRLLFLGGLDIQNLKDVGMGGGHAAMPFLFTGVAGSSFGGTISDGVPLTAGGPSLDYYLASKIAASTGGPQAPPILVQRALRQNGDDVYLSFAGPAVGGKPNAVTPYDDPAELWSTLFATVSATQAEQTRLRAEKKSVLDLVGRRLEATCARLGAEDRDKCEQHLTSVRAYEKLLGTTATCTNPEQPDATKDYATAVPNPNFPDIVRLQSGMLVSALACGVARTGSLLWCNSHNNQVQFSWLAGKDPAFAGASVDSDNGGGPNAWLQHHEIAHNEGASPAHTKRKNYVDNWFIQQVSNLMKMLFDVKEGDKTLLDRTLIVVANLQNSGGGHGIDDIPFLLAGNCNGYFKTGRVLRYTSGQSNQHIPVSRVFPEICNAMGFPQDSFGDYPGDVPALRA